MMTTIHFTTDAHSGAKSLPQEGWVKEDIRLKQQNKLFAYLSFCAKPETNTAWESEMTSQDDNDINYTVDSK